MGIDAGQPIVAGRAPTSPPSVLPDISPTRGEIGRHLAGTVSATLRIGEGHAAS